ncbi:MAG: glutathione S-transferase family protein [Proteobacteria bacterium]|nr:glutathione S-transferase family protein [Pseudomonadota bacterium]
MQSVELISNHLCPFTQRAAIQLAEKGAAYKHVYIDLADKPAWFSRISPLGKVPVLRMGDETLFETTVICEFLEETVPGLPLYPAEPLAKARHRAWIEFASATIADIFGFYTASDASGFERKKDDLRARFSRLDGHLEAGPYFAGKNFHLVDAAFAPIFRLFDTFDRIADFRIFSATSRIEAYRTALAERQSVQQAVVADYGRRFENYLAERGSHLSDLMGARN